MKRPMAFMLAVLLAAPYVSAQDRTGTLTPRESATIAGEFVHGLRLGTRVKLVVREQERVRGMLMAIEDDAVVIRPQTRIPEPARRIALSDIVDANVEHDTKTGQAVAIGVVSGAATFLGILLTMLATLD